jgi:hypothetical protein
MEKCLKHSWATNQEGYCFMCEQERSQQLMREELKKEQQLDSIVTSIIDQFTSRAKTGKIKYGVDLDRTDLSLLEWIEHAKQEHMDAILYLEKIKQTIQNGEKKKTSHKEV